MRLIGLSSLLRPAVLVVIRTYNMVSAVIVSHPLFQQAQSYALRLSSLSAIRLLFMFSFYESAVVNSPGAVNRVSSSIIAGLHFLDDTNNCSYSSHITSTYLVAGTGHPLCSAEHLWRSMWWQEREASDMVGVFFSNKSDRRSMFLPALFNLNPILRCSPTSGFFEMTLSLSGDLLLSRLTNSG